MNKSNIKNKIVDYIIIINIILFFLFILIDVPRMVEFINIYMFIFLQFLLLPINEYIKSETSKSKLNGFVLMIKIILITIISICLYRIVLSDDYNLKYTYWLFIGSFILKIIIKVVESLIEEYNTRIRDEKKYNILNLMGKLLLAIFLISIPTYGFIVKYMQPSKYIFLNNVKTPDYIEIHEYDSKASKNNRIESLEDINKIIKELNSIEIRNIRFTELLNYEKMKNINKPNYIMTFNYEEISSKERILENGYISYILVTSNGSMAIERINWKGRSNMYIETFPIKVSKETADMIYKYFK